jgi:hypothetical protein
VLLIIRNAAFVKIPLNGASDKTFNMADCINSPANLKKYMEKLLVSIKQQLPNIPEKAITLAIKSNVWDNQTGIEDSSSRLIYILVKRFQDYRPIEKIDRGAESPDKSWFGIAKKNAEYYGFNKRMLDELYRIAGDNKW